METLTKNPDITPGDLSCGSRSFQRPHIHTGHSQPRPLGRVGFLFVCSLTLGLQSRCALAAQDRRLSCLSGVIVLNGRFLLGRGHGF